MSKTIRVIAAVIFKGTDLLICQRPEQKRHAGLWEFPGGKMRAGETRFDAGHRELGEELGVTVIGVGRHLFTARDPGSPFSIEFVETRIEGEPQPLEHSDLRWCPVDLLDRYRFAPADSAFIRACFRDGRNRR